MEMATTIPKIFLTFLAPLFFPGAVRGSFAFPAIVIIGKFMVTFKTLILCHAFSPYCDIFDALIFPSIPFDTAPANSASFAGSLSDALPEAHPQNARAHSGYGH